VQRIEDGLDVQRLESPFLGESLSFVSNIKCAIDQPDICLSRNGTIG
jgi:hypothetical protein